MSQPMVLGIMQDAYILSTLLSHSLTTCASIPTALQVYDGIRLPFAYTVFERSRQMGKYYGFYDAENPRMKSTEWDLQKLGEGMQKCGDWQTEAALPESEMEKAVSMLEKELS